MEQDKAMTEYSKIIKDINSSEDLRTKSLLTEIEVLKKEVDRLTPKLYESELNKPNPQLDNITFSEDVFTISESGLHGLAYYDYELCKWCFHTDQLSDEPFKWYYPIVKSYK
jgi:hypothetical protein